MQLIKQGAGRLWSHKYIAVSEIKAFIEKGNENTKEVHEDDD